MATPLVLPYEILNSDKTVFFRHLGSFIGRDIPLDETIRSNKKHNVKANHYINYKLRIFNSFIYSSSVNNYSILHNRSSEILFIRIKQIINYFSSKNKDKLIQNKLKKDILKWSNDRFVESNINTQSLTGLNLNEFNYKTTPNKT